MKNKTRIYKTYQEFLNRENKKENGVSEAMLGPRYFDLDDEKSIDKAKEDNATNEGCWDCYKCKNCKNCQNCDHSEHLHTCYGCENCSHLYNIDSQEWVRID